MHQMSGTSSRTMTRCNRAYCRHSESTTSHSLSSRIFRGVTTRSVVRYYRLGATSRMACSARWIRNEPSCQTRTIEQSIVSEAAKLGREDEGAERFLDPRSKQSFLFDHLSLVRYRLHLRVVGGIQVATGSIRPSTSRTKCRIRAIPVSAPWCRPSFLAQSSSCVCSAALETSALTYLAAHYHDGVTAVFSDPSSKSKFVIQIVANKYNPSNFWYACRSPLRRGEARLIRHDKGPGGGDPNIRWI